MKKYNSTLFFLFLLLLIPNLFILSCKVAVKDSPKPPLSKEEQEIETVIKSLSIPSIINPEVSEISLPQKVSNVTIFWESSDLSTITNEGKVTHKEIDEEIIVKLKAVLKNGTCTKTVYYNVKVLNKMNETIKLLSKAKDVLSLPSLTVNEDVTKINLPLSFSEKEYKDIVIVWNSLNEKVITNNGTVTHSDKDESDIVSLYAILSLEDNKGVLQSVTKEFKITVKNKTFTGNVKTLNDALSSITVPPSISSSVNEISLIKSFTNPLYKDIKVNWKCSDNSVIDVSNNKVIHKDSSKSDTVLLSLTLTLEGKSVQKDFSVEVCNSYTDQTLISLAKEALTIDTEIKEDEDRLYVYFNLGEEYEGVSISYTSSNTQFISPASLSSSSTNSYFNICHEDKAGAKDVLVTATLTKGSVTATKEFTVRVLNYDTTIEERLREKDLALINEAIKTINIPSTINEYDDFLELPNKFFEDIYKDITITWESENADLIDNSGKVTHVIDGKDRTVILKATFSTSNAELIKTYSITVKNPTSLPEINEIIQIALNNVTLPKFRAMDKLYEDITLPSTCKVGEQIVTLSWYEAGDNPSSNKKFFDLKENVLSLRRNIEDVTIKIKVLASFVPIEGSEIQGEKTFDVVIPSFTYFDKSYNENMLDYISIKDGSILEKYFANPLPDGKGERYSISDLDVVNNTIKLKLIEKCERGVWTNLESEKLRLTPLYNTFLTNWKAFETTHSVDSLYLAISSYPLITEEITLDELYGGLIEMECFAPIITENTPNNIIIAKGLSEDIKKNASLKGSVMFKSLFSLDAGVSENATMEKIVSESLAKYDKAIISYDYSILDEKNIKFTARYDYERPWNKQEGDYESSELEPLSNISFIGNYLIMFTYKPNINGALISLNDTATSFIHKDIEWTITSNPNKESINVTNGETSLTLSFKGNIIE